PCVRQRGRALGLHEAGEETSSADPTQQMRQGPGALWGVGDLDRWQLQIVHSGHRARELWSSRAKRRVRPELLVRLGGRAPTATASGNAKQQWQDECERKGGGSTATAQL